MTTVPEPEVIVLTTEQREAWRRRYFYVTFNGREFSRDLGKRTMRRAMKQCDACRLARERQEQG